MFIHLEQMFLDEMKANEIEITTSIIVPKKAIDNVSNNIYSKALPVRLINLKKAHKKTEFYTF